ncbi:MAG: hypothetical protein ACTSWY_08240 [Promethearchaeota archaeon]
MKQEIESLASTPQARLDALQQISDEGIPTYIFISPIFPEITDWKAIIKAGKSITNAFMFENLNFRSQNVTRLLNSVQKYYPEKVSLLRSFKQNPTLWAPIEEETTEFCQRTQLNFHIEFHHGGFFKKMSPRRRDHLFEYGKILMLKC